MTSQHYSCCLFPGIPRWPSGWLEAQSSFSRKFNTGIDYPRILVRCEDAAEQGLLIASCRDIRCQYWLCDLVCSGQGHVSFGIQTSSHIIIIIISYHLLNAYYVSSTTHKYFVHANDF